MPVPISESIFFLKPGNWFLKEFSTHPLNSDVEHFCFLSRLKYPTMDVRFDSRTEIIVWVEKKGLLSKFELLPYCMKDQYLIVCSNEWTLKSILREVKEVPA